MAVYLFAAIDVGSLDLAMTIYQISDKGSIKTIVFQTITAKCEWKCRRI